VSSSIAPVEPSVVMEASAGELPTSSPRHRTILKLRNCRQSSSCFCPRSAYRLFVHRFQEKVGAALVGKPDVDLRNITPPVIR